MAKKREVFSAFILHDDQTWEQPSFSVPAGAQEADIEKALLASYGGFYVAGLQTDDDAPKEHVSRLDVTPNITIGPRNNTRKGEKDDEIQRRNARKSNHGF